MIHRSFKVLVLLCAAALCCTSVFGADDASDATLSAAPSRNTKEDYVIQPSDLLKVQVFQEDDLTREVRVTQGSSISLPLIGSVDLKGLTLKQAEEKIRDLYNSGYLVNPQINVSVEEYATRTVNVLGAVNKPGAVPFPQEEGMTLLDAIARAGGFNRYADRRKVKLSRTDSDGKTQTFIINADELIDTGHNDSWPLKRDDVIFVPERIL